MTLEKDAPEVVAGKKAPKKRRKKVVKALADFEAMAKLYQIKDDALFDATLNAYKMQIMVIENLRAEIEAADLTTKKEYIKGVENLYVHPAIRELPRHIDSLNKTAALLLNIIEKLRQADVGSLDEFDRF